MLKVGQKVRIRKDLELGKLYVHDGEKKCSANASMMKYIGKEAEVKYTPFNGIVKLDIDNGIWYWSEGMLELCQDLKEGTRVMVKNITGNSKEIRSKYESYVGIVKYKKDVMWGGEIYKYGLEFENPHIELRNKLEGVLLFKDSEVEVIKNEVIDEKYSKVIINYPATIYILKRDGKEYKGISKVCDGDVYDREKGIEIAKTKAEIKMLERKLKDLSK